MARASRSKTSRSRAARTGKFPWIPVIGGVGLLLLIAGTAGAAEKDKALPVPPGPPTPPTPPTPPSPQVPIPAVPADVIPRYANVTVDNAILRGAPTTRGAVVTQMPKGAKVIIPNPGDVRSADGHQWLGVIGYGTFDGMQGWMAQQLLGNFRDWVQGRGDPQQG